MRPALASVSVAVRTKTVPELFSVTVAVTVVGTVGADSSMFVTVTEMFWVTSVAPSETLMVTR